MAPVTLRNVQKSFGVATVIHGVSIDIADGEFVVLVGPSGCGKSTLLRMIAGLEPITGGEIDIGARVVNDLEPKDRNIAMVFQNYALYPHMTVEKNMGFSLEHRGASKAEIAERVNWAADILGLTRCCSGGPVSCRADSASGWPWVGPSCAIRRYSCSMSRSPTSTPSCASSCAARSRGCTSG
jgi:ABC-type sugar transport system ATPase subunit